MKRLFTIFLNLYRQPAFLAGVVFLCALALYTATLAPGLLWGGGDFASFQTFAFSGKAESDDIGIFGHPLWPILAHPFTWLPIRDVAWRANFAAAVFGSLALAFVFLSAWRLTRSTPASLLATGALAVSHTFWTYTVMPKVYSLNALLLAACIYLLLLWREKARDRYLYLFAFLYGFSFLNHLLIVTAAAGLVAFIGFELWSRRRISQSSFSPHPSPLPNGEREQDSPLPAGDESPEAKRSGEGPGLALSAPSRAPRERGRGKVEGVRGSVGAFGKTLTLFLTFLFFALGLAPYLFLVSHAGAASATSTTILTFLKGMLYPLLHPAALLKGLGWGVVLGVYQFPLTSLIGLIGLYALWRRDRSAALLVILSLLGTTAFLFAAIDPSSGGAYVWNLHYYLQAYLIFTLALAFGFKVIWDRWCARQPFRQASVVALTLFFPIFLYALAPTLARPFIRNLPDFRPLPGRDNLTYVLSPWKQGETGARDLGEKILEALPAHSILVADYSLWAVIHYLQVVENARPDVELVLLPPSGQQVLGLLHYRAVPHLFLADTYRYYDVPDIQHYFLIIPTGPIYRLVFIDDEL